jgi:flavodoxin
VVEALEGEEEDRGRSKPLTDTRLFGNSALRGIKIARTIGEAVTPFGEVKVLRADKANPSELSSIDFLIVGSPTRAGRATRAIKEFLKKIPTNTLKNVGVTSFDTRFSAKDKGAGTRMLLRVLGYAAGCITESLKGKDGYLAAEPEGFIVEDSEGPLKQGELERAAIWAKGIIESKK